MDALYVDCSSSAAPHRGQLSPLLPFSVALCVINARRKSEYSKCSEHGIRPTVEISSPKICCPGTNVFGHRNS